jgi:hypothetical protein
MNDEGGSKESIWMASCKLKNDCDYMIMIGQDLESLELTIIEYHRVSPPGADAIHDTDLSILLVVQ